MNAKFIVNIECAMSLKWSQDKMLAFHYRIPIIQVGRQPTTTCHLLIWPPHHIKMKNVIARWIALIIMEDGGCSTKVTNPNIIKVAAKSLMYYSPAELERLHCQLGAKHRCMIMEAN
jgi:hypothetical protein